MGHLRSMKDEAENDEDIEIGNLIKGIDAAASPTRHVITDHHKGRYVNKDWKGICPMSNESNIFPSLVSKLI